MLNFTKTGRDSMENNRIYRNPKPSLFLSVYIWRERETEVKLCLCFFSYSVFFFNLVVFALYIAIMGMLLFSGSMSLAPIDCEMANNNRSRFCFAS